MSLRYYHPMLPDVRPSNRIVRIATACTRLALLVFITGIPVSMAAFNRANAVPYSVLNHAISELGFPFASSRTWVFNGSVALSSLLLLPMLWVVARRLHTFIAYAAAFVGTAAFGALALM